MVLISDEDLDTLVYACATLCATCENALAECPKKDRSYWERMQKKALSVAFKVTSYAKSKGRTVGDLTKEFDKTLN